MEASKQLRAMPGCFCCSIAILLAACNPLSEHMEDPGAGLNGSFEIASNGLPVNWLMYTPNTAASSEFQIVLDREIVKDGLQSLRFDVQRSDPRGAARAPGFTNEFFDSGRFWGPAAYRVSFWIRNSGAEFAISAGPVSAKTGDMRELVHDDARLSEWTEYEYATYVPEDQWLRMQMNVLSPGTLWIDDVRITEVEF